MRLKGLAAGDAVLAEHLLELGALLRAQAGQQDVLRGGQANFRLEPLDGFPQTGLEPITIGVPDAAIFDEKSEEKVAVGLAAPAELVALGGKLEWAGGRKLEAHPPLHFLSEPFHAPLCQDIFQTGVFAVGPVAKIAVNGDDGFGGCFHLLRFRSNKADDIRQARKGLGIAVRHSHAAPGQQVVAGQPALLFNNYKAGVVGEDVDVVEGRNGEGELELAGKITLSVKRVGEGGVGCIVEVQLLALNPD